MTTPVHTIRTDEGPDDPILAARREQAHAGSASKLSYPLPEGYVCRTDEGEGTVTDVSEEVRLKLARTLVAKMDTADPELRTNGKSETTPSWSRSRSESTTPRRKP